MYACIIIIIPDNLLVMISIWSFHMYIKNYSFAKYTSIMGCTYSASRRLKYREEIMNRLSKQGEPREVAS